MLCQSMVWNSMEISYSDPASFPKKPASGGRHKELISYKLYKPGMRLLICVSFFG